MTTPEAGLSRRSVVAAAGVVPAMASVATGPRLGDPLAIEVRRGTPQENETRAQLLRLLSVHDLSPWVFTDRVMIDQAALPHSHPVLTLHTRHLRDDDLLLSTFLHEQLHWFLTARPERTAAAVAALQTTYPDLPVGYPRGSSDAAGNHVHLLVGLLEWNALKLLVGELRAFQAITFWAGDHYTALYRLVLDEPAVIGSILRANDLAWPGRSGRAPVGR